MVAKTRTTRTAKTNRAPERKKRIPVSGEGRNIFTIENRDPAFVYRWVNDKDGRIQRFIDGWWEFVAHEDYTGDRSAEAAKDPDSMVTKKVGGNTIAYLMRIKKEYYDEDQRAKAKRVDAVEEAMFRDLNKEDSGLTGKITFERK
mgnify:FL=1